MLPGRRRQGVGSALLELAKQTRDSLALWTFQANTLARACYEARGFRAAETSSENEERAPAVCYRWSR